MYFNRFTHTHRYYLETRLGGETHGHLHESSVTAESNNDTDHTTFHSKYTRVLTPVFRDQKTTLSATFTAGECTEPGRQRVLNNEDRTRWGLRPVLIPPPWARSPRGAVPTYVIDIYIR